MSASAARYSPAMKWVHWLTAAAIAALFALGWTIDEFSAAATRKMLLVVHQSLGLTIILLAALRLVLRRNGIGEADTTVPPWMQVLARLGHAALYVSMIALPVSGWVYSSAKGAAINFFWLVKLPRLMTPDLDAADQFLKIHEIVGFVVLGLIGLHVGAALYHHLIRRDDTLLSMLPSRGA